jgi:hypothetical protein
MTTQKNPIPNMIAGTQGVPIVDFACHEGWQIVRDSGGKRSDDRQARMSVIAHRDAQ